MNTFKLGLLLGSMAGVLVACAIATPTVTSLPSAPATPASNTVMASIKLFQFQPKPLEITAGATVLWTNEDDIEHSITQGEPPLPVNGGFDSGFITQGQTFSFTFETPGEYLFFCQRHNSMTGKVIVSP